MSHPERRQTSGFEAIADPLEAREQIEELFDKGERPVVSIPREYISALESGLRAHATWIPGIEVIAGTLGRDPYLPEDEDRVLAHIKNIPPSQVEPRFTGPRSEFQGVVVLHGPISPEDFEIIENPSQWHH